MPYLSVTRLRRKSCPMTPRFMKAIQPTYDQPISWREAGRGRKLRTDRRRPVRRRPDPA